jgi:hypothetical protein
MVKVFYDWEFDAESEPSVIEPISLGMKAEDGQEIYLINADFDWEKCRSQWLKENVKPTLKLEGIPHLEISKSLFSNYIGVFTAPYLREPSPLRLVGYYADYDHVCLCQRFGTMMQLPDYMPMFTLDLKQWCDDLGNPSLPEQTEGEHNALLDARWLFDSYKWLKDNYQHPAWSKI